MDSSGDNPFDAFKHFPVFDIYIPSYDVIEEQKLKFEKKEIFWQRELAETLNFLSECLENYVVSFPEDNVLASEAHITSSKAAYEAKLLKLRELKEITKSREKELKQTTDEVSEEAFNNLLQEVLELERAKEKRIKELTAETDITIKRIKFYENYLDCHITFTKPDLFTFYPEKRISNKWIKLSSDDLSLWEFVDGSLNFEEKENIKLLLEETNCIRRVICESRKIFKNQEAMSNLT